MPHTQRFSRKDPAELAKWYTPVPVWFCTWPHSKKKLRRRKISIGNIIKEQVKHYIHTYPWYIHTYRVEMWRQCWNSRIYTHMEWGRWIDLSDILWPHLLCMDMCMLRETCATFLTVGYNFIAPHTTYPWNESSYVSLYLYIYL